MLSSGRCNQRETTSLLPIQYLIVELQYAVDYQVFGPWHEPGPGLVLAVRRVSELLIHHVHAGADMGGALREEAVVLLARLEEYKEHYHQGEPRGEHVVLDGPKVAHLRDIGCRCRT